MNTKQKLSLVGIIITLVVGILTIISMINTPAKPSLLISLFASGFGCGASLVVWIKNRS